VALARAAARHTRPAVAVEASRGHRRRVRGEVVEWVATRPSTPGPCPRPARAVALSPKEALSSSLDLLARIMQLVPLVYFWCREYFKVPFCDTLFYFYERFWFLHRGRQ